MVGYPFLPPFTLIPEDGQANIHLYPFPPVTYKEEALESSIRAWQLGSRSGGAWLAHSSDVNRPSAAAMRSHTCSKVRGHIALRIAFKFGEGEFDGVEVRTVRRQKADPGAACSKAASTLSNL